MDVSSLIEPRFLEDGLMGIIAIVVIMIAGVILVAAKPSDTTIVIAALAIVLGPLLGGFMFVAAPVSQARDARFAEFVEENYNIGLSPIPAVEHLDAKPEDAHPFLAWRDGEKITIKMTLEEDRKSGEKLLSIHEPAGQEFVPVEPIKP